MPVYRKHKLLHIHIPRTGGTAIEKFFHDLGDMVWGLDSWLGQEQENGRWYEFQHLALSEIKAFTGSEFESFASFAVVRNPYAKLVSDYLWRQSISRAYPDAPVPSFPSFEHFIDSIPSDINSNWDSLIQGASQSQANFLIHVRPQYQYLEDGIEPIAIDHVLRFERLDEGMGRLMDRFGIEAASIRKPPQHDFLDCFMPGTLEVVNRIYRRDFDLFDYPQVDGTLYVRSLDERDRPA